MTSDPSRRPLTGLTVTEYGSRAAAYATKLLADHGADAITIEPEGGDPLRHAPPFVPDEDGAGPGSLHRYLRTNRRAVALPLDADELTALLTGSRVFITDQPDDQRIPLGLGTAQLRERFPHLLVATISPFGATGPAASARGGELVTYGAGGLAQATPGLPDGSFDPYLEGPLHPGGYPAAITSGLTAAIAVLCELPRDDPESVSGDHLDVSEQASVASLIHRYLAVTAYDSVDVDRTYPGPLNMPNLYLPCRDGYVVIAAVLDPQWRRLVEAIGSTQWAQDPRFEHAPGRNAAKADIEEHLRPWCLERDGDEIVGLAARHGVPCFRFHRIDEMAASAHAQERRTLVEVPGTVGAQMPGAPFKLTASPWQLARPAPVSTTEIAEVLADWRRADADRPVTSPSSRGPLEGIRVLDFGQVVAIPFGTQWMAWLGADVILVESERHLHTRATPPFASEDRNPNTSAVFNLFNGGKRSLSIDIKSDEGQRILQELVPHCDVVVENFRAGALDRIGLSYKRLRELREDIILLGLGAFGRAGPMKDAAGLHSSANLYSGLADVTRYPGGAPRIMGGCMPDPLAGMNAVLAILLALQHRRRTGEGQFIDEAMYECLLPLCAGAVMSDEARRTEMRLRGSQGDVALFGGYFPAQEDGTWLAVQVDDGADWERLWHHLGLLERGTPPPPASTRTRRFVGAALTHWLMTTDVDDAVRELRQLGLAAAPTSRTSDLLADEQLRATGFVQEVTHPIAGARWLPTLPWRMAASTDLDIRAAPLLGEHVDDILGRLVGYDHDRIEELRSRGILS